MKKLLSFAAVAAFTTSSFAASDLASAFKEGKTTGQIRAMYIGTNVDSGSDTSAFALGGKLAYETAPLYGISLGAAFYTTNDLGTKNSNLTKVDESVYGDNGDSYSILGQAYVVGQFGKTTIKVGRQQIDTPLAGSDDTRMIPNLFEAALVTNTDLPDTTLIGGYVSRMAGWESEADNAKAKFNSMSDAALGDGVIDDNGVYVAAAINNSINDLTLQAWEYYAVDVLNAIYLQADYKLGISKDMALNFAGQYYNMRGIGETKDYLKKANKGKIDYNVYGLKADLETPLGFTPYVAYNKISEQTDRGGGTYVFGAWGGVPEFTQTEELWDDDVELNDASVVRVGVDYSLEKLGLGARTIGVAYTMFDVKDKYNNDTDSDKRVLDVVYSCEGALVKNLDARIAYTAQDSKINANDKQLLKVVFNYNF